jgi:hypothetical protein
MNDADGPVVAQAVYKILCSAPKIDADDIAYALDAALEELRKGGVSPSRWGAFVHYGA